MKAAPSLVIEGIVPVMLTPFDDDHQIDFASLHRLVTWYLNHGADALFAVCQSSEMQHLTLQERVALSRAVVEQVDGRIPVVASGHVSDTPNAQLEELLAIAHTGVDAVVLVTNRLDVDNKGADAFKGSFEWLLARLPDDLPLGLYECPAPYRRLLSDAELKWIAETNRVLFLKDVCCDRQMIKKRLSVVADTQLNIVNANAAMALDAMQMGSHGFCGVFTNFHPDLYRWMYRNWAHDEALAAELGVFLALAGVAESMGYPALAKAYHQRLGTISTTKCRVLPDDILSQHWAVDVVLDKITQGTEHFRARIAKASI